VALAAMVGINNTITIGEAPSDREAGSEQREAGERWGGFSQSRPASGSARFARWNGLPAKARRNTSAKAGGMRQRGAG